MNRRRILAAMSAFAALPMTGVRAFAQEHPVRLLVPFAAGGPSDAVARVFARTAAASGPAWVVENRPGADGIVAARAALASARDGNTLLYMPASLVGVGQLARPALDVPAEFQPISGIGRLAFGLFTTRNLEVSSVRDLVELARARPGQLNFASSTHSELMAAHQFMRSAGVSMVRVPYKGAAQALPDLLEGRVQLNFGPLAAALPHASDGRLRLLATLLPQRSALAPDTPTMAEAGYPSVDVPTWQALFAPARLPDAILLRLSQVSRAALADATLRRELEARALVVDAQGPRELQATAEQDRAAWSQLIRAYQLDIS